MGIKCDKVSLNFNNAAKDACHLKRYVLSYALFVQSKFLFWFDQHRFFSFLCKTKPFCHIVLVLHECVFFRVKIFFHNRWLLLWMCQKEKKKGKKILFRLGLNAIKRLWCNVITEMFLAFSLFTVNLHQHMHLCCVGTKYFVLLQLLLLYPSAILASN